MVMVVVRVRGNDGGQSSSSGDDDNDNGVGNVDAHTLSRPGDPAQGMTMSASCDYG